MTVRRRRNLIILLAAALGLLTTLTIAAACGLWLEVPYPPPQYPPPALRRTFILGGRPWVSTEFQRPGLTAAWWTELTRDYFDNTPAQPSNSAESSPPREDPNLLIRDLLANIAANLHRTTGPTPHSDRPAPWGTFASGRAPADVSPAPSLPSSDANSVFHVRPIGADFGYGWPCIALWFQARGHVQGSISDTDSHIGGWVIEGEPEVRGQPRCRVVPFWPAWKGLVFDTLLFGALWWLLLVVPGSLRRTLRRRRGRCAKCGYDLHATPAGAPCPECGERATGSR